MIFIIFILQNFWLIFSWLNTVKAKPSNLPLVIHTDS